MRDLLMAEGEGSLPVYGRLAHLAVRGLGEVGNGILHPLVTPSHAMLLLALSLMIGQKSPLELKANFRVFAPASALALALTTTGWVGPLGVPCAILGVLVIAPWVAAEKTAPIPLARVLCAVAALLLGLDSPADPGTAAQTAKSLIGTWIGLNGVLGYLSICASHATGRPWARIALRVLASWLIAIAFLVLAFALRK